jgi:hypothetical protein
MSRNLAFSRVLLSNSSAIFLSISASPTAQTLLNFLPIISALFEALSYLMYAGCYFYVNTSVKMSLYRGRGDLRVLYMREFWYDFLEATSISPGLEPPILEPISFDIPGAKSFSISKASFFCSMDFFNSIELIGENFLFSASLAY